MILLEFNETEESDLQTQADDLELEYQGRDGFGTSATDQSRLPIISYWLTSTCFLAFSICAILPNLRFQTV